MRARLNPKKKGGLAFFYAKTHRRFARMVSGNPKPNNQQ